MTARKKQGEKAAFGYWLLVLGFVLKLAAWPFLKRLLVIGFWLWVLTRGLAAVLLKYFFPKGVAKSRCC
jgi:uncharacterized membrane protein